MFQLMAQQVWDAQEGVGDNVAAYQKSNNSIVGEVRLTREHLTFKWMSNDPNTKCSKIVAAINIKKVMPKVIVVIPEQLCNIMSIYFFGCAG